MQKSKTVYSNLKCEFFFFDKQKLNLAASKLDKLESLDLDKIRFIDENTSKMENSIAKFDCNHLEFQNLVRRYRETIEVGKYIIDTSNIKQEAKRKNRKYQRA